ncbi:MAG: acyltransferase domain-containing protein, partial [Polyangiaceae bacterium]|nr:acyltransferase domain-containing protein [Polyangiaceae bacterium]
MSEARRSHVPIAVVGASALFPGSSDARGFWSDILAGRDLVTDVPASHWLVDDYYDPNPSAPDKTYSKRGAFLSSVDFDPMEFGVPPSIVPATDTAQILALIVAQRVLEDASGGQFASMDRERMSVVLGVTSGQELLGTMVSRLQRPAWLQGLRASGVPEAEAQAICDKIAAQYVPWQESSFPGLLGNVVAGRIANRFDLRGTNAVTDAACASSLAALSMGVNELALGQSDLVIVGGVDTMNDIFMYMCFSKTPALSPTGDCRPFSDAADGTLLGEGLAMLALKRLDDAERDGDRVYAVIRGIGSASDGRSKSVYAPLPEGQARALRRAYEVAGFSPATVELVEAHGTGTKAGDVAEFEGLRIAFDESGRADRQWCALGSVKSQIGHTKATAGAAGLFKAVMALHHKVLPPTIKVARPNPKLEVEASPFYLNTEARPWIRDASHPRRASVSSFGFGGSNFHVALEEFVPRADGKATPAHRLRAMPAELVTLSGTPAELVARCRELASSSRALGEIARESQGAFSASAPARLAIVAADATDLRAKLEQAAAAISASPGAALSTPTGVHYSPEAAAPGDVGLLFPGQGSQYVGMGRDLAMTFAEARGAWDEAAATRFDGVALHEIVFPRPVFDDDARAAQAARLTATEWTQPALGVTSLAALRLLRALGLTATCAAGHSFGEVSALAAAGALDAASLVAVARRRGELMRDASATPGGMLAVSKPLPEIEAWLSGSGCAVVVANHNSPTQVVLSGALDAIEQAERSLSAAGIQSKRLPVATGFHSPLVAPSAAPFLEFLRGVPVATPTLDVVATRDASVYPAAPDAVRARLAEQLAQPVRFVDQIEAMYARGVRTFVEVGAGAVLSELASRTLAGRPHAALSVDRKGKHGVVALLDALARLSVLGVQLRFDALWTGDAPLASAPAKKKPAMVMPINGSNYGKPYPPASGASGKLPPNPPRAVAREVVSASASPEAVAPQQPAPGGSVRAAPVVAAAPQAAVTGSSAVETAWVQAYQEAQRQTAEAHAAYQRAMADSHMAFLRTSEASLAGLGALLGGGAIAPVAAVAAPPVAAPPVDVPTTVAARVSVSAPVAAPAPAPVAAPAPPLATPTPVASPSVDLEGLMLAIVAEKTGYPREMLAPTMELEADLGID